MNLSHDQIPVYVIDDDGDFSEALSLYLAKVGYLPETFASSEEFLSLGNFDKSACVVLDNHLPGKSGLDTQKELKARNVDLPIVFMSGESGFQDVVAAVKDGAITFLEKPFRMGELKEAITEALKMHQQSDNASSRLGMLTSREREIYDLAIKGFSIKRIAENLSITTSTVEFHRSNVLRKLEVGSFSELMAQELDKRK